MSIFEKICPQCAAVHSIEAADCACGYSFNEGELSFSKLSDEMLAEEEKLYEEYLAARAEQAAKDADATKGLSSGFGSLDYNQKAIDEKELDAKIAQAQLNAQANRVAKANKKAADAKAERKQKALDAARRKAEKSKARAKAKAKAAAMVKAKQKVDADIESRAKAENMAKAKLRAESARNALLAARAIKDKIQEKTSALFRAKQAEKAEQVMQKRQIRKVSLKPITEKTLPRERTSDTGAQHSTAETSTFRATQAARAKLIEDIWECPNCTAQLSKEAKSCKCGYKFEAESSLLPSLSLDVNDIHDTSTTVTDVKITTRRIGN